MFFFVFDLNHFFFNYLMADSAGFSFGRYGDETYHLMSYFRMVFLNLVLFPTWTLAPSNVKWSGIPKSDTKSPSESPTHSPLTLVS